jgi:Spy/CpxP family protein refolding chaperone
MRTAPLSLIAATLIVMPLVAQNPPPPMARTAAPTATRSDTQPVPRLTEAQWDKLDAIRNRNAKEERAAQEAARVRRDKMQADVKAVMTPEQYAQYSRGRGMSGGRGMGMRSRDSRNSGDRRSGGQMVPMRRMDGMEGMHGMPGMGGQPGMMGRQDQMRGAPPAPIIPPTPPARPETER